MNLLTGYCEFVNFLDYQTYSPFHPQTKVNIDKPSEVPRLSKQEKRKLRDDIHELSRTQLKGIIEIVTKGKEIKEDSLVFDISKLSPRTTNALKKYVDECRS